MLRMSNNFLGAALLLIAVMALAQPEHSQLSEYTVGELLEPCMEGDNDSRWGAAAEAECEQYTMGFTDAYLITDANKHDNVCLSAAGGKSCR